MVGIIRSGTNQSNDTSLLLPTKKTPNDWCSEWRIQKIKITNSDLKLMTRQFSTVNSNIQTYQKVLSLTSFVYVQVAEGLSVFQFYFFPRIECVYLIQHIACLHIACDAKRCDSIHFRLVAYCTYQHMKRSSNVNLIVSNERTHIHRERDQCMALNGVNIAMGTDLEKQKCEFVNDFNKIAMFI